LLQESNKRHASRTSNDFLEQKLKDLDKSGKMPDNNSYKDTNVEGSNQEIIMKLTINFLFLLSIL
jgi:hypothetical protein